MTVLGSQPKEPPRESKPSFFCAPMTALVTRPAGLTAGPACNAFPVIGHWKCCIIIGTRDSLSCRLGSNLQSASLPAMGLAEINLISQSWSFLCRMETLALITVLLEREELKYVQQPAQCPAYRGSQSSLITSNLSALSTQTRLLKDSRSRWELDRFHSPFLSSQATLNNISFCFLKLGNGF